MSAAHRLPTRAQSRRDEDTRYYAADHDLDRARRFANQAEKLEEDGHYGLARAAWIDAARLFRRHQMFLIIDPEAIL